MDKSQFAAKISSEVKKRVTYYCIMHGIKFNYFIEQALISFLNKSIEDEEDYKIAKLRLTEPNIAEEEFWSKFQKSEKK